MSLKLVQESPKQKESSFLQPGTLHQSTARTDQSTKYYKNYFSNMFQAYRLFLQLSCLKSLRSTYLSYRHVVATFVYQCLCFWE